MNRKKLRSRAELFPVSTQRFHELCIFRLQTETRMGYVCGSKVHKAADGILYYMGEKV